MALTLRDGFFGILAISASRQSYDNTARCRAGKMILSESADAG
jgi:hypothetical protein